MILDILSVTVVGVALYVFVKGLVESEEVRFMAWVSFALIASVAGIMALIFSSARMFQLIADLLAP